MHDPIQTHTLRDGDTEITVLSMGCAIQDWTVAGRRVVLGYDDMENYRENPKSMGIVVGRIANRTAGSQFELDGQIWKLTSRGERPHLHGGPGGIGWQNWQMEPQGDRAVNLRLHSPHLDQGYPGAVDFVVRLTLDRPALTWDMTATPDRKTPINLAQHVYFNLAGRGTIRDHSFQIAASHYTPVDQNLIPTGVILPVDDTRYDLRAPRLLDAVDPENLGYDLNFALDQAAGPKVTVRAPDGMTLTLWTDRKGLQLYTSNMLSSYGTPHPDIPHDPFAGFCVEAQDFPNTVNTPDFGSILCTPDAPYRQRTTIRIAKD
ncbi:aldose epimerase family protein [Tropicibacter oceani]|uniref:Aldose epimerase family protein n=1 Tax=Tropicibacter oceani TaxID=3058420 RepID=A0ABY8QI88_9RHOB|nr:aldose epimerase family protein [Tropicibacter oceani]WGW04335.1 aldose epimerase family protein [Tropicibacter oceani]